MASGSTSPPSPGLDRDRDRKEGKTAKAIYLLALNPEPRARVCAQKPRDLAVTLTVAPWRAEATCPVVFWREKLIESLLAARPCVLPD